MVRQRKVGPQSQAANDDCGAKGGKNVGRRKSKPKGSNYWGLAKYVGGIGVVLVASLFGYRGYLETRVNTPFSNEKLVKNSAVLNPNMSWGSYRPGTYFGLKTRDPHSPVMGLMWFFPRQMLGGGKGIRHWCETGDNLQRYGWTKHDGRTFGVQEIYDGTFKLETSFIKSVGSKGGEWSARVHVTNTSRLTEDISLIWYTALDEKGGSWIKPVTSADDITNIIGETSGLGKFAVKLKGSGGTVIRHSYLSTVAPGFQFLTETVQSSLKLVSRKKGSGNEKTLVLAGDLGATPNFVASQIIVRPPFTFDISYNQDTFEEDDDGTKYTEMLQEKVAEFSERFRSRFGLSGYSDTDIHFAEAALSNMLGGIGYFYGASKVQSLVNQEPVPYWEAPLFTGVPSRPFFPRGFLWDEGFHGLLIGTWDLDLELDIMNHWFDLMNVEGWIPREQILGAEALAKVPEEFVTQRNSNANPPTFFLTLKMLLKQYKSELRTKARLENLQKLYPRLQKWFSWYNTTQKGDVPGTYRWRGRDETSSRELNPKTLTSGLDDFPRASHPNSIERHLDLRCWIALAAEVMVDLADLLSYDSRKYSETFSYLSDFELLNELHLSPRTELYADYGLHSDRMMLKKFYKPPPSEHEYEMLRFTIGKPAIQFVDATFGYVNLFPFLMQMIPSASTTLKKYLTAVRDPEILWTPFGLRSLSKKSPLYMARNTEHDPPYWRGQIWININYLALRALHYYKIQPGPYSEQARKVYTELRTNVVNNIIRQYNRTGYIWEQYNDASGEGSGCRPFTGWSSLVLLIMAEQY